VVNVATQKKIIKKKTRVCRHDREPSFNETFRFNLNPVGHSIQVREMTNYKYIVTNTHYHSIQNFGVRFLVVTLYLKGCA